MGLGTAPRALLRDHTTGRMTLPEDHEVSGSDGTPSAQARTFQVRTLTIFPKAFVSDMSAGLPAQLEFATRVRAQHVSTDAYDLYLKPYAGPVLPWFDDRLTHEPVSIVLKYEAITMAEAVAKLSSFLDPIIDDLAFQLQEPVKIHELEFLDVTPPVTKADEREMLLFPFPGGYDQLKLHRSTALGAAVIAPAPLLRASYAALTNKVQEALDWYIKALHASYDVDRFIFLWVSCEILRGLSGIKVEEPTKLRCGHAITQCPECAKPTTMFRQAQTTARFLAEFAVKEEDADELWRMRQVVHGARSMTQPELTTLTRLLPLLRSVVLDCLKKHLGVRVTEPPLVAGTTAFGLAMAGLGGSRVVTAEDLL